MPTSAELSVLTGKLIAGTLLFVRITGMMASAPLFRSSAIPIKLKIVLSIILASSLTSAFWKESPAIDFHLWTIAILVAKEFLTGLAIGFSASAVFWAARMAGGLIDFDMGYQAYTLFNVEEGAPTMVGELQFMAALMIFLGINGHHYLLEALWASVAAVPLTTFSVTKSTVEALPGIAASVFVIALKIAAPALIALFLTNLALALLARVAPQTNIFILSFQLKIAVGLLALFVATPLIVGTIRYFLGIFETEAMKFIMTLSSARV